MTLTNKQLHRLDLNLLRLFLLIYEFKNFTHVAAQLHVSQSAVSHALNRLRHALDDALFYREKGELYPTPFAKQLYPTIAHLFVQLQLAFEPIESHDDQALQARAREVFSQLNIAMQDEVELIMFERLVSAVQKILPDCCVYSTRVARSDLAHELKTGQVDFAIDVARVVPDEVIHQPLLSDEFVVAYYAPNFCHEVSGAVEDPPPSMLPLDTANYFASQHITVSSRRQGLSIEDSLLAKAGWQRHIKIRCQHYASAWQLLKQDKLLLTLPKSLALTLVTSDAWQWVDLPIKLPRIELHRYWHVSQDQDVLHRWLRQQIFAEF